MEPPSLLKILATPQDLQQQSHLNTIFEQPVMKIQAVEISGKVPIEYTAMAMGLPWVNP
jgi:hypothetical protein